MNPNEWILGSDTGVSSKTIWAVMVGVIIKETQCGSENGYDIPHDPDDFGRCYRLLKLFPEWKKRLKEIAKFLPKWRPMIREWRKMTVLYEEDKLKTLYDLMQELESEGMLADGWSKTGEYGWERK